MSCQPRQMLLGYVRAELLRNDTELAAATAKLDALADRESFSLGTIYVERGLGHGAFHALMTEVGRDEGARGVVVPDLRHMTVVERLILNRHESGARTSVFVADFSPRAGGPGVDPDLRRARRSNQSGRC